MNSLNVICDDNTDIDGHLFNLSDLTLDRLKILDVKDGLDLDAIQLMVLYGHHLYSVNEDFRDRYLKETGGTEFSLPSSDLTRFLCKDYFNILFYGLVVYKYMQKEGVTPREFPVYCGPGRNPEAQRFIALKKAEGKDVKFQVGIPFYYHVMEKSKVATSNINGLPMIFCTATNALKRAQGYMEEMHNLAKLIVNYLESLNNQEAKEFLDMFTNKSWSIILGK